jgi:hypothetical protein
LVYNGTRQKQKRGNVDTAAIIAELEAERDRLTSGRKRHLSAAARKRISEAMKKRWAEREKVA